jgi:4-hydroxybenzoate polyprenyltransferase
LIVAITMLVMRYAVLTNLADKMDIGMKLQLSVGEFFMLMMSAVLLTAAGNIINDYFDRKVDMINRPDRVIVGKHVKRRVAIILHQVINATALLLAAVVSARTGYWWPMIIPLVISTLLWWYSPVFKKKVLIGNMVVAICTAAVPLWAMIYEIQGLKKSYTDMMVKPELFFDALWQWTIVITASAFVLTLVREAVKDIEDMEGDGDENYQTLPIRYGVSFTKKYSIALLIIFLLGVAFVCYRIHIIEQLVPLLTVIIAILLPTLICIVIIIRAESKMDFHKSGIYLKWLMLGGLITLVVTSQLLV